MYVSLEFILILFLFLDLGWNFLRGLSFKIEFKWVTLFFFIYDEQINDFDQAVYNKNGFLVVLQLLNRLL